MAWSTLGSRTPTLEWQVFDIPVISTEAFRITNRWSIPPYYKMQAYLGQFFGTTAEVFTSKIIYPTKDRLYTVELKIPEDFRNHGILTRYIGIKLGGYRRIGLLNYDWQVEIDEFIAN